MPEAASFVLHDCLDVTDPTGVMRAYTTYEEDLLNSGAGMTQIDLFYVYCVFFFCTNITMYRQLRRLLCFTTLVSYMMPLDA